MSYLETKGTKFENKLHGKEDGKYYIEDIEKFSVEVRLIVKLHGQTKRID